MCKGGIQRKYKLEIKIKIEIGMDEMQVSLPNEMEENAKGGIIAIWVTDKGTTD